MRDGVSDRKEAHVAILRAQHGTKVAKIRRGKSRRSVNTMLLVADVHVREREHAGKKERTAGEVAVEAVLLVKGELRPDLLRKTVCTVFRRYLHVSGSLEPAD